MGWDDWIRTVEIVPAISARDAAKLQPQIEALMRTGCRIIHVNASEGGAYEAVSEIAPLLHRYQGIVDVHLFGEDFTMVAAAGADSITFDALAVEDVSTAIEAVRGTGVQVGIAFGAGAAPEEIAAAAAGADLVLCVCEGDDAVEHIAKVAPLLSAGVALEVEGDVGHDTVAPLYAAGAKLLVTGQPIFEREDLPRAYRRLVQALA
jgi:pentose-5-phosphate-3-epimerase